MSRHCVYRCFDADDQAIYVGLSAKVWDRLKAHKAAPWAKHVARVKVSVHPSRDEGRKVEVKEINRLEPMYNREVHLFDTIDWDQGEFFAHTKSLAELLVADSVSPAHPIARLEVYYRRKFGRSLLADIGPLMIQRRGRVNDVEPKPLQLQIRGADPQSRYIK